MKKLTLDTWEQKYVAGEIRRFDQKYTMFARPQWDDKIKELMRWVMERSPSKPKAGYTLQDLSRRLIQQPMPLLPL